MLFSIGDGVMVRGDNHFRKIVGIQIKTYLGLRGSVTTDYILYLGSDVWRDANEVIKYKKKGKSYEL